MNNSIGFQRACAGLKRMVPLPFVKTRDRLNNIQYTLMCIEMLKALNEMELNKHINGLSITGMEFFEDENNYLIGRTLDEIYRIAPIDDVLYQYDFEFDVLIPEVMSFQIIWDDWYEMCENPKIFDEGWGLFIFFTCLRLGDSDSFNQVSRELGWGVEYPSRYEIDTDVFEENLNKHGLCFYINAYRAIGYCTGNHYYDFNPSEGYYYGDLPEFNLESVLLLAEHYREALIIQADLEKASEHFLKNKDAPKQLLEILKIRKTKPETLFEIFREEK